MVEAQDKLQIAVNESHSAPPAKYLRESAAACIIHGLQAAPSGLQMTAVPCTRVIKHVNAKCPDVPKVMDRLQSSKYFTLVKLPGSADYFLLDLHAIIAPQQVPNVADILASIKFPDNVGQPVCHQPTRSSKGQRVQIEASQLTVPSQVQVTSVFTSTSMTHWTPNCCE